MALVTVESKKDNRLRKTIMGTASIIIATAFLFGGKSVEATQLGTTSFARGDDYPYYYKDGSQEIDQWRMYSRQCTSFAAFRLSSVNGFELPGAYGNANEWGYRALREGYRVDTTPAVGAIAWDTSGQYGHVAWVSNVIGDMIEIEEYNYGIREKYNRRTVKASSMTGFIHFKDVSDSTGNSYAQIDKLSGKGTHYFTKTAAIKNQPLISAGTIDYYHAGEEVRYDQILEKDGYKWLSYVSYNGSRRYVQLEEIATTQNGWNQQGSFWKYQEKGRNVTGWKQINGNWYHFNSNGVMSTGWVKDGSKWYYLKPSGEMQTGWLKDNGTWYYLESSGAMKASQWFQVSGKYYYVNASGALAVNTTIDGFQVDSNGARVEKSTQ